MCYEYLWRNKFLTADAKSIGDMIQALQNAVDELRLLQTKGVTLSDDSDMDSDCAYLITEDSTIAAEYGFELQDSEEEEDEFQDGAVGNTAASLA